MSDRTLDVYVAASAHEGATEKEWAEVVHSVSRELFEWSWVQSQRHLVVRRMSEDWLTQMTVADLERFQPFLSGMSQSHPDIHFTLKVVAPGDD